MEPQYDVVHSPDEDAYYAEFWDGLTGKDIWLDGERLMTVLYPQRYQANKAAKRYMREMDWTRCTLADSGAAATESEQTR